jgi:hypothetical protein
MKPLKTHPSHPDSGAVFGPKAGDFAVGSIHSRAAARAMLNHFSDERREEIELANQTPSERASLHAMTEDVDNPRVRIWMVRLFRAAKERAKVFQQDLPSPTPEEIRHGRALAKEIHRIAGGVDSLLQISNPAEWRRLKTLAEKNVRTKEK